MLLKEGMDSKKFEAGAKAMRAYANKHGGVDKKDFMDVANMLGQISRVNILQAGQVLTKLNRVVSGLDTDVRERVFIELKKVGLVESVKIDSQTLAEKMTEKQMSKREDIVKGMKKKFKDMVDRYGSEEKAKEVMYATATKMAMDEAMVRGKEVFDKTFANRKQADNFAAKNGGRVKQVGRVFYVFKEEVDLDEKLNKDSFHTSVEKVKFMKSKYGTGEYQNAMFLHDLDNKGSEGKPMLVTFARQVDAEKTAKKFGGKIIKSGMGTFRIIKEDVELDENAGLIKDYQGMKAQGKKDSNILDALMSMPKYKRMSKDQMAKIIGDAKRKGIFKEEVELDEANLDEISPELKQRAFDKRNDKLAKDQDDYDRAKAKAGGFDKYDKKSKLSKASDKLDKNKMFKKHDLYKRSLGHDADLDKHGQVRGSDKSAGQKFQDYKDNGGRLSYNQYKSRYLKQEVEFEEEKDTHKTKDGRTAKKGLYYNIMMKRKRGEKPAPKGDPDRPSAQDFKNAEKTAKEEVIHEGVLEDLQDIVKRKAMKTVKFADGRKTPVDMTTANAMLQVYNKLNDQNKKKFADGINKSETMFMKMVDFAFSGGKKR